MKPGRPLRAAAAVLACVAAASAASAIGPAAAQDTRRSGFADIGAATQALQRDDTQNPAWLWVEDGRRRFQAECTTCHDADRLRGAAARHPAWDAETGRPLTLGQRINRCRARSGKAAPLATDSDELLALQAYVGLLSRGLPIRPDPAPQLVPWREAGARLFKRRMGQLDFSCAQCHDQHAGGRLAGAVIPQGHPTGYPIYRLEWQGLGSLQRRLRNCMTGVRAEPFADGSDEALALELFLVQRAAGMPVETPAVRP